MVPKDIKAPVPGTEDCCRKMGFALGSSQFNQTRQTEWERSRSAER